MTAPDLNFHAPQRRAQSTNQAEREAAARIIAECADKPVRRVTTEWLRTQPSHAQAYARVPWSQRHKGRGRHAAKVAWAEPVGVVA